MDGGRREMKRGRREMDGGTCKLDAGTCKLDRGTRKLDGGTCKLDRGSCEMKRGRREMTGRRGEMIPDPLVFSGRRILHGAARITLNRIASPYPRPNFLLDPSRFPDPRPGFRTSRFPDLAYSDTSDGARCCRYTLRLGVEGIPHASKIDRRPNTWHDSSPWHEPPCVRRG